MVKPFNIDAGFFSAFIIEQCDIHQRNEKKTKSLCDSNKNGSTWLSKCRSDVCPNNEKKIDARADRQSEHTQKSRETERERSRETENNLVSIDNSMYMSSK